MQKSGVKTLSIIDTISELAQNENEASRLTLPSPISLSPKKSPVKVNPKMSSPSLSIAANGARPKFNSADSVDHVKTSSPLKDSLCNNIVNVDRLNLSAISSMKNKSFQPFVTFDHKSHNGSQTKVQTPDWIREIFEQTRLGNLDFLVRHFPSEMPGAS